MSYWLSWLPSLPSVTLPQLPSQIERRFVSFALKKSLGHLLKPGQLDVEQIDSQIGSGYVNIHDIQVDPEAVNALLPGLPIELDSGNIGRVSISIPWPNPLNAASGFTLDGLDLVFVLSPSATTSNAEETPLAQSVTAAAESFLHEELLPAEETALRESFHTETTLPGSLNPFLSEPDQDGQSEAEEDQEQSPAGVSIFAALVERLIANFQFNGTNLSLTLIVPGKTSITFSILDFSYKSATCEERKSDNSGGLEAMFSLKGVSISMKDLHESFKRTDSPSSSTSSLDDDAQFSMSQSLAFLPPRADSPSSSMYASAVSFLPGDADGGPRASLAEPSLSPPAPEAEFLGFGPTPIEIRFMFPSPSKRLGNPEYTLSINIGAIGCAVQPWQLCALSEISALWPTSTRAADAPVTKATGDVSNDSQFRLSLDIRAINLALLPPPSVSNNFNQDLDAFFSDPSRTPAFAADYTFVRTERWKLIVEGRILAPSERVEFEVHDAHAVSLRWFTREGVRQLQVEPILIANHGLLVQPKLSPDPSQWIVEASEWSNASQEYDSYKLSHWRRRARTGDQPSSFFSIHNYEAQSWKATLAPLHVFLSPHLVADLLGVLAFISDLREVLNDIRPSAASTPTASISPHTTNIQQAALRELDLDLDYLGSLQPTSSPSPDASSQPLLGFFAPRIRIEVIPPSVKGRRTGPLVLDVCGLRVSHGSSLSITFSQVAGTLLPPGHDATKPFLWISSLNFHDLSGFGPLADEPGPHLPSISMDGPKVSANIPAVNLSISKAVFDGLQYLADDLTQYIEQLTKAASAPQSSSSQLIGSRFFTRSRGSTLRSSSSTTTTTPSSSSFTLSLVEVVVRLDIPRIETLPSSTAVVLRLSDSIISLDTNRKGKLTINLSSMNASISVDINSSSFSVFALTTARGLASSPDPIIKVKFSSYAIPETGGKESKIDLVLAGFTLTLLADPLLIADLSSFFKAPPGVFEAVVPNERTSLVCRIIDGALAIRVSEFDPSLLLHFQHLHVSTAFTGGPMQPLKLTGSSIMLLLVDDVSVTSSFIESTAAIRGTSKWLAQGYALFADIPQIALNTGMVDAELKVGIESLILRLHLCADTTTALSTLGTVLTVKFASSTVPEISTSSPEPLQGSLSKSSLLASIDGVAYRKPSDVGVAVDLIGDDLPTNMDYIDEAYGAAAGFRELEEDDLDEFDVRLDPHEKPFILGSQAGISSRVGGETIKMLRPEGLKIEETYFNQLPIDEVHGPADLGDVKMRVRLDDTNITLFLYDGYDWNKTRKSIEDEAKNVRRRLAKIKQLLAAGQVGDPSLENTSTLLFNSIHIGLDEDIDTQDQDVLMAAIEKELEEDLETATQSSWQTLPPTSSHTHSSKSKSTRVEGKRLRRSRHPRMEFKLSSIHLEYDQYSPDQPFISRLFAVVKDLEILDHIKQSTWKKFLTDLYADSRGNVRETGSNMVQIELIGVRPVKGHPSEEARLRAKILPLRLYVDQYAVEFLKKFFSFQTPESIPSAPELKSKESPGIYFQLAEVFPIDLKLDYKPRRVDYRALKEGRTIELMNFFHFDGAEMTLRHITLAGISGWPRLFDLLNDLWTPDVKATQLVDVISGVAPIRSVVNVGSGVADLVLLPIAQYKKDGRIVRGLQKGTTAFVKSTAMEAIKLGAQLATGTQVILEQAEGVLGGQFKDPILTEALRPASPTSLEGLPYDLDEEDADLISKYAEQPTDLQEGLQSAYHSIRRNLNSAAQTILAVPMEMHERAGSEGPVRSVIRAVPIAVLKPMIGASEAVSKTLLGLHNTLDPNLRYETDAKYKHRND